MTVMVCGLPGSGKSYFAQRLAACTGAVYISSDRLRRELFRVRTYSDTEKQAVYSEMLSRMREAGEQGRDVVVDATFYREALRKQFLQAAARDVYLVEIRAAESLARERLQQPRAESEAGFEVYHQIQQQWEPIQEPHLILQSTDSNITELLQKATDYLHPNDDKATDR